MPDMKQTIELLVQKRDYVTGILALTQEASFLGREQDVETYIDLMTQRQGFFDQIMTLDETLATGPHQRNLHGATGQSLKAIQGITEAIQTKSKQVLALDKKNQQQVDQAKSLLTGQIKDMRQGQNLHNLYGGEASHGYGRFDITQ